MKLKENSFLTLRQLMNAWIFPLQSFLWQVKKWLFSRIPLTTTGARALVIRDDHVLLVKHTYTPGWHSVGGGVKRGESAREAIVRELYEEGGIHCLHPPEFFGIYLNTNGLHDDHVILFLVTSFFETSDFPSSSEILEKRWFALRDLPAETTRATRRRIEEYLSQIQKEERW